jgi:peptidoglycan hydrolase-like protein with peptidoglycan-binding domain
MSKFPCITAGATDVASGGAVSAVQEALRLRGRSPFSATGGSEGDTPGVFGPRTLMEVQRFQSESSLAPDGIIGPQTGAKLGLTFQSCGPSGPLRSGGAALPPAALPPATLGDKLQVMHAQRPWAAPVALFAAIAGTFALLHFLEESEEEKAERARARRWAGR